MSVSRAQNLPIIGPWMGKIGRVNSILSSACNPTPEVWVQAAFHGVPQLAIALLKPDWFDYRTEQLRGYRNKKRGKRFIVDDMIQGSQIEVGKIGWTVFQIGSWAQRLAWYMCVIDAGIDFSINWTSMAYQWSGCTYPDAAFGKLKEGGTVQGPIAGTFYADWDFDGNRGGILATPDRIGVPPAYVATPTIDINWGPPPDGYPRATYWSFCIYDLLTGREGPLIESRAGPTGFGFGRAPWKDWWSDLQPHEYVFLTKACDGWLTWNGTFEVVGYKDEAVLGDP